MEIDLLANIRNNINVIRILYIIVVISNLKLIFSIIVTKSNCYISFIIGNLLDFCQRFKIIIRLTVAITSDSFVCMGFALNILYMMI